MSEKKNEWRQVAPNSFYYWNSAGSFVAQVSKAPGDDHWVARDVTQFEPFQKTSKREVAFQAVEKKFP